MVIFWYYPHPSFLSGWEVIETTMFLPCYDWLRFTLCCTYQLSGRSCLSRDIFWLLCEHRINWNEDLQFLALCLNHCILVDSSTIICHMSLFVILRVVGLFCPFCLFCINILFLMENPVSKRCRPWSDATMWHLFWSAMFAYDPFRDFQVRMS